MADTPQYEFSPDEEKAMRQKRRAMNILPYNQPAGKVGTVEGVDVRKEVLDKGSYTGTPKVQKMPEGLY